MDDEDCLIQRNIKIAGSDYGCCKRFGNIFRWEIVFPHAQRFYYWQKYNTVRLFEKVDYWNIIPSFCRSIILRTLLELNQFTILF